MAPDAPAASAWRRLSHHLDGLAIGTTVDALARMGVLDELRDAQAAITVGALAARAGFAPGPLSVAMRLLACQGVVEFEGDAAGEATGYTMTAAGRDWLPYAVHYAAYDHRLTRAAELRAALAGRGPTPRPAPSIAHVPDRVRHQLAGPAVAAAFVGLHANGALAELARPDRPLVFVPMLAGPAEANDAALSILADIGWIEGDGAFMRLTEGGLHAATMAGQYAYAVGYVPSLLGVRQILAGEPRKSPAHGTETHVDRALDIAFSGEVFRRTCRAPFLSIALPLFDAAPLDAQPAAIVDTGAGDGTLLVELFSAIRDGTARGRALDRHPLVLVVAEPSDVAREIALRRLTEAGVTTHVFSADIGKPDAIAAELVRRGIDPMAALHVNKSVIHDRDHVGAAAFAVPGASGAYAMPNGRALSPDEVAGDLIRLLMLWRPFLARHGMISIEAHTAHPALSAARVGASIMSVLDAGHGYSCQYLLEAEHHRTAAAAAGLKSKAARDLATAMVGRPILTIDHWVAA